MKKRVMILGSLGEFCQLVRMAKERGIYTVVCDGYPDGPAKKEADRCYDIDVRKIDEIAKVCKQEQVDGIITSFSDLLFECMVKISEKAGLPCYMTSQQAELYRNKVKMKEVLEDLGIKTPKNICLKRGFCDEELSGFSFPAVIKPVDSYGSRGLYVVRNADEIRTHFELCCESSEKKEILLEEYHSGYEFNMMTWVLDGEVKVISIADREKTQAVVGEIPNSTRNVYPSRFFNQVYDEAREVLQKFIDYTGQTDGALSMQFFWDSRGGVQVCEIAGRFFGYEHELVEISSGFSIEKLLLDYMYDRKSLKKDLLGHGAEMDRCSAVLYFHGREAVIQNQSKAEELGKKRGVVMTQLFYQKGETVTKHGKNPYVVRYYLAADSREQVDLLTDEIFAEISITDAEGKEILYRNQRCR